MTELQKEEIYVNYKPKVEGYISSRISDNHDVEDVVSSVFVKIYHNIDAFDNKKASLSTWILTISELVKSIANLILINLLITVFQSLLMRSLH